MPFTIDDPEADRLARELSALTGEPLQEVVREALRARLPEEHRRRRFLTAVDEIQAHVARLPTLDPRSPDELLGYDENGLPT